MMNPATSHLLEFRTPLKGKRVALGLLLGLLGGVLVFMGASGLMAPWPCIATGGAILAAALGLSCVDCVTTVDAARRQLRVGWRFCGVPVWRRPGVDLARLDAVKLAATTVMVGSTIRNAANRYRTTYPVWCLEGPRFVAALLGFEPEPSKKGRIQAEISRTPDTSRFFEYARHVAAASARHLGVDLIDGPGGARYAPDKIPPAWLDRGAVRFDARLHPPSLAAGADETP